MKNENWKLREQLNCRIIHVKIRKLLSRRKKAEIMLHENRHEANGHFSHHTPMDHF